MTKSERSSNAEARNGWIQGFPALVFELRASFVIRHSSFVISSTLRHSPFGFSFDAFSRPTVLFRFPAPRHDYGDCQRHTRLVFRRGRVPGAEEGRRARVKTRGGGGRNH